LLTIAQGVGQATGRSGNRQARGKPRWQAGWQATAASGDWQATARHPVPGQFWTRSRSPVRQPTGSFFTTRTSMITSATNNPRMSAHDNTSSRVAHGNGGVSMTPARYGRQLSVVPAPATISRERARDGQSLTYRTSVTRFQAPETCARPLRSEPGLHLSSPAR
jgi:hypothetical protein